MEVDKGAQEARCKDKELFSIFEDAREKGKFNWRSAGVRDAVGQLNAGDLGKNCARVTGGF